MIVSSENHAYMSDKINNMRDQLRQFSSALGAEAGVVACLRRPHTTSMKASPSLLESRCDDQKLGIYFSVSPKWTRMNGEGEI